MSRIQVLGGIGAVVLVTALLWARNGSGSEETSFRFASVERGDLEQVVSATGTLDAVTTVQVGTQVSGIINEIYVDFNDDVKEGQIIARLDRTLLEIAVQEAQSNLTRSLAQYEFVKRNHERTVALHEQQLVSEQEFNQSEYDLRTAEAAYESSRISLDRAQRNLGYATVYAPISGRVIERNVDVGQTVAASMSTPQLFLIANDLSAMRILAAVDESDIGEIEAGQAVRFTVQAYPDETFEGTVEQVRLQSTVQENVVNYTVAVSVRNETGRLLPGMTATVEFLVRTAEDVLKVPNAALRFRPTEAMLAELQERRREQMETRRAAREAEEAGGPAAGPEGGRDAGGTGAEAASDSVPIARQRRRAGAGVDGGPGAEDVATLYYVGDDGKLAALRARKGITDGQYTELMGPNVAEGMQVITAVTAGSGDASSAAVNPFQPAQDGGGGRGPGGGPRF
jgi:HlyD family secretion protein